MNLPDRRLLALLALAPFACTTSGGHPPSGTGGSEEETGGAGGSTSTGGKTGTGGKAGTGGGGGSTSTGGAGGATGGAGGEPGTGGAGGATGGAGGEPGTGGAGGTTGGAGGGGAGGSGSMGVGQLFGTHTFKYPSGAALPTVSQAMQDAAVKAYYDKWKAAYVKPGCGGYYVRSGGGTGSDVGDEVSEGHGYGMVITPIMAGHDPDAKKIFDGMYAFFRKFPSQYTPDLRGWTVSVSGGCKFPSADGKSDSATDGDLDVAFGLLLADKQWGSTGAINYLAEARKVITAIKTFEMNQTSKTPLLGDWAVGDKMMMAKYYNSTRPSDFMIDHFRAFGAATGDAFWMGAVDGVHTLVATIQGKASATTGLLPDFVINTTTMPAPAPANFLEDKTDGAYAYNSCRVPWRLVTDWVASGDPRAKAEVDKIVKWIETKTGGDPSKIVDGYSLSGTNQGGGNDWAFEAPFGVAGIVDKSHQAWVDAIWKEMAKGSVDGYYGDSIKLLSMVVMSGNWWAP